MADILRGLFKQALTAESACFQANHQMVQMTIRIQLGLLFRGQFFFVA